MEITKLNIVVNPENIPPEIEAKYHYALGRFMHNFALLEVCVNDLILTVLADEVDQSWDKIELLKASIGGLRFAQARDALKRLLRLTKVDEKYRKEVDRVLAHVGEIHFLRDRLAHNAAGPAKIGDEWWFGCTNRVNVREFDDLEVIYFDIEMLHNAADDLAIAEQIIVKCSDGLQIMFDTVGSQNDPNYKSFLDEPAQPWLYKPSRLKKTGPKYRRNRK